MDTMLKLRHFTFKGHSVLWLSGSRSEITRLRGVIASSERSNIARIALSDFVTIENPDGVKLFATSHEAQPIAPGELHWPCLRPQGIDAVDIKLERILEGRSIEETFDLWPAPAELLLECAREDAS